MHSKFAAAVATTALLLIASTAATQTVSVIDPGPTIPPMFQAYDSKTGQLKTAVCVQEDKTKTKLLRRTSFAKMSPKETSEATMSIPQAVSYSVAHITDSETLQSTLHVDASASFSFGLTSGSGSYQYFSSANFSRYSEYLTVEVDVENQSASYANLIFTPKAQKLIDKSDYVGFYKLCGDSFIDGQVTGGYFLAIAKFDTTTSSEQTSTSAALQATVGLYGSASADMTANLKTLNSFSNVQVQILRKGPNAAIDDTIPGIIKYAQDLPDEVAGNNGYVTKLIVAEYPGDPVASIPPTQAQTIDRLARLLGKAYQRKAGLKYVRGHQDQFPQITLTALVDNENDIDALISSIKTAAQLCETNVKNCAIAKYPIVPDLYDRAEWDKLTDADAKACPAEKIAETKKDENLSIEMHGYWTAWATGNTWMGVNQSNIIVQDHDNPGKQTIIAPQSDVLYQIPPYSVVKWIVGDGPTCAAFGDNRVSPDNPIAFRMFDERPIAKVDFGSLQSNAPAMRKAARHPTAGAD